MARRIGKYEILNALGQGGMGTVYKARDTVIGREVAIKLIQERALKDPAIKKRFYREARSAGRLSHDNITIIHDIDERDGTPFLVMELLEGEDLRDVLNEGRTLSNEDKLHIAVQVCRGLQYAHDHEVVHRDIKPANIRLLRDGRVKIMDFGIARIQDDAQSLTLTNASIGTPRYMSPEQVQGERVDLRSDIFSFGVLFYELLTGRNPFSSDRITTVIYKIIMTEPDALVLKPEELAGDLQPILDKCLAKNREDRYDSFGEVLADLQPIAWALDRTVELDGPLRPKTSKRRFQTRSKEPEKGSKTQEETHEHSAVPPDSSLDETPASDETVAIRTDELSKALEDLEEPASDETIAIRTDRLAPVPSEEPKPLPVDETIALPVDENTALPVDETIALPVDETVALPVDKTIALPVEQPKALPTDKTIAVPIPVTIEEPDRKPVKPPSDPFAPPPHASANNPFVQMAVAVVIVLILGGGGYFAWATWMNPAADGEGGTGEPVVSDSTENSLQRGGQGAGVDSALAVNTPEAEDNPDEEEEDDPPPRPAPQPVETPTQPRAETPPPATTPTVTTPATGNLTIRSTPNGADILINGQSRGTTPLTLQDMTVGQYALELRINGYRSHTQQVSVREEQTQTVSATLAPLTGRINLTVNPGGRVLIDGRVASADVASSHTLNVPLGPHTIRVEHPELGVWQRSVRVTANATQSFNLDFTQEFEVRIGSFDTEGGFKRGEIYVDGSPVGRAPRPVQLRFGRHEIEVRMEGYTQEGGVLVLNLEEAPSEPVRITLRKVD